MVSQKSNKFFKTLVNISKVSWNVAIILLLFNWMATWSKAWGIAQYVMEDKFIYIGVLGGWIFILIFYISLILILGRFMQFLIKQCAKDEKIS